MEEIWKDVPDYQGLYQVSNLGRVRSLPRQWITGKNTLLKHNGKILKCNKNTAGYLFCSFLKNGKKVNVRIHQVVAITFLNHKPCGHKLVIDHINENKLDNRLCNLRLVTQRFNCKRNRSQFTSNYKGVSYNNRMKKWQSSIQILSKKYHLGTFENEHDAHLAYQNALQNLEQ